MTSVVDALQHNRAHFDDSDIIACDYHMYYPYSPAMLGNNDVITITLQNQDLVTDVSKSFIYVQGKLTKEDGTGVGTASLVKNFVGYLFDEIRYRLGNVEVERTRNVGMTSTIKNYVLLSSDQSKYLQIGGWHEPNELLKDGVFSALLPLSCVLGFAEDYKLPIVNIRQELTLLRSRSDKDCLFAAAANTDKIVLEKVGWLVPHLTLSDQSRVKLMKLVAADKPIQVPFRSWMFMEHPLSTNTKDSWTMLTTSNLQKPKFVIVGLQTGRKNNVLKDNANFDSCNVQDMKVYLNAQTFPFASFEADFAKNQCLLPYEYYARMKSVFHADEQAANYEPLLTYKDFRTKAPLFVFDTTKTTENPIDSTIDLRLEYLTSAAVAADTIANAVVVHDQLFVYHPLSQTIKKII
ncbi:uncharacterized protein LOC106780419 [Vigna radiata var. radiata]|uniref:Uncharacterized protein LOC106780419 n=1 Tax=Vigna radiata var. radiata TaxID=3916 RepID=A0A1S3W0V0_VIGRR|nr:uncharacterized protein LOC106780419 [Vigna radiata var. radiata]XP_018914171.1 PREDICTED: uncharacterized protein LOC109042061 [Bemisia tabaci]